jgi:hypothetical protein
MGLDGIDRAIARSIQQDRGWIFSRTARTIEVSKFFYYMALYVCRNGKKGYARSKYQVRNIFPKNNIA